MKIPKDLADKAKQYVVLSEQVNKLFEEVAQWFNENGADGVVLEDIFVSDTPQGILQSKEGEYCDQYSMGISEDSFQGSYYHQVDGEASYVGYRYWC